MKQGRDRNDHLTGDLLSWSPPEVVKRFDDQRIKTANMRARIARAVSETLTESELSREEIAEHMAVFLGEECSKNMLDAYASEAREDHTIPYLRLIALVHTTGDVRLLQIGAELFGHLVVDNKFMKFIELGMMVERGETLQRLNDDASNAIKTLLKDVRAGASS